VVSLATATLSDFWRRCSAPAREIREDLSEPQLRWRVWLHAQRVCAQDRKWIARCDGEYLKLIGLMHEGRLGAAYPVRLPLPCGRRYYEHSCFLEFLRIVKLPTEKARRQQLAVASLFALGNVNQTTAFKEALVQLVWRNSPPATQVPS